MIGKILAAMRGFAHNCAVADSLLTVGYRNKSRLLSISFSASHTDLLTTKSKQFTCSCFESVSRSALTKPDNKIIFTILIVVLYQKTCGKGLNLNQSRCQVLRTLTND